MSLISFPKSDPHSPLPRWILLSLITLIVLSGIIRIPGLMYGFPEIVMRDEPTYAGESLRMLREGTLDPEEYRYGNFIHYFYLVIYSPVYYGGKLFGGYSNDRDFPEWHFYLISRSLSLLFSLAALWMLFQLGRRLFSPRAGLIAAILLATNLTFFRYGQLAKLDIYVLFLSLWAALLFVKIIENGDKKSFRLLGILLGIGIATKYSMVALSGGILILFVFLRRRAAKGEIPKDQASYRILIESFAIAFFLSVIFNLFIFLNFEEAWKQIRRQYRITVQGRHPMAATLTALSPWMVLTKHFPESMGWPLVVISIIGWILWGVHDTRRWFLVSLYPALHYLMVFRWGFAFSRELLPLYPPLYLGTAFLLDGILRRFTPSHQDTSFSFLPFLLGGVLIFSLFQPAQSIYEKQNRIIRGNTKVLAKKWIETHIPSSARIARDGFALPMEKTHPDILFSYLLASHPYNYYIEQGVQYLVKSRVPESVLGTHPEIAGNDREIEQRAEKLKTWNPEALGIEGPEISIYRIPEDTKTLEP